ncbi:MAG: superoxide dismutase family protein [Gammaproteobacteria bacterium]|nr:superoxide dismutase family protein [Gammaproteobacteria bacterium]
MNKYVTCILSLVLAVISIEAQASLYVRMHLTGEHCEGRNIGTIKLDDTIYGVLLTPNLKNLPAGVHGFHVHAMAMCEHMGMAAGGHLDPDKSDAHRGPYSNGHLGDLPVLIVGSDGKASLPVLAPRLHLSDIKGKTLMVHAGKDNYSDTPQKLGGGGERIACGLIPYH